jgi:hypothetical protein
MSSAPTIATSSGVPARPATDTWIRDDLQRVLLAETGRHECIDVLIVNASALLDEGSRECRRGGRSVLRNAAFANGLDVCLVEVEYHWLPCHAE